MLDLVTSQGFSDNKPSDDVLDQPSSRPERVDRQDERRSGSDLLICFH